VAGHREGPAPPPSSTRCDRRTSRDATTTATDNHRTPKAIKKQKNLPMWFILLGIVAGLFALGWAFLMLAVEVYGPSKADETVPPWIFHARRLSRVSLAVLLRQPHPLPY
jgi:hypothetical protein